MFERYQAQIDKLIEASVNTPGDTEPALRKMILHRGISRYLDPPHDSTEFPSEWTAFADKVALSAASITDRDFEVLSGSGKSDDAILEIIYCAALAEGIGRLEAVSKAAESE